MSGIALGLAACLAAPAGAQQPQQLPVISVTGDAVETADGPVAGYVATRSSAGSKTDTALIDTPQSISVVTRQQMDDQAAQTLDQALRYVPAVYSQDNDLRFDQLTLRGFAADSYLDGMKLNRTTWFANPRIDPYFLERIDVLRGPASVLYGQASPGGLVDMVTKRPSAEPLHSIEMGVGNDQRYQLGFDFGGPVDQDGKWLYRVTGLGRDANTQTRHVEEQRIGIAPALTWQPSSDTKLTFLGSYQYDPEGGLFNPVPAAGTVRWNPNGHLHPDEYLGNPDTDRFRRTQYSAGYLLEHRFNNLLQVRQNVRYLHDDVDYYQTSLSSPLTPDQRSAYMWANINREHMSQFTIDNQAQLDFGTGPVRHTVLAGVDYQYLQNDIRRGGQFFSAYPIDIFHPDYNGYPRVPVTVDETTRLAQIGAYLQEQLRWDRWLLTLGGRRDYASTRDVQDSAMTGANMASSRTGDHAFTWRGGLSYKFDNGIAPYVSYSTSFQPQSGADWDGNPFIPTRGKQYEVGIKFQPERSRSYATVAVFDLRQENVVTPDPDPSHPLASVQAGEIRSRGVELEGHAELSRELSLIASYAYLDNVVTKSTTATQGKHPTGVPKHMASAWADYTIRGGDLSGLGFGAGARYVGKTYGAADNDLVLPSRVLIDAAVHYDTGRWRLALNASNLFDKEYLAYCTSPMICYWGASRTVLATARYQW
uniref:TonB-dependent siderophore receptor n=1 Tax=Bordetella sputigena TaxID=1416810 RepID=UPI0039F098F2